MITIVDYDTGNLNSIANMIRKAGGQAQIANDVEVVRNATKLILPGVGHVDYGMKNLRRNGMADCITQRVLVDKVPILGICLGAQLMMRGSEEGAAACLGWIDGETVSFDQFRLGKELKVPHMGWSDVRFNPASRLFEGFTEIPRFYFVHSYHLQCHQAQDESAFSRHGYEFVVGVERNNILGVQFHPEKSHRFGLHLMKNFIANY